MTRFSWKTPITEQHHNRFSCATSQRYLASERCDDCSERHNDTRRPSTMSLLLYQRKKAGNTFLTLDAKSWWQDFQDLNPGKEEGRIQGIRFSRLTPSSSDTFSKIWIQEKKRKDTKNTFLTLDARFYLQDSQDRYPRKEVPFALTLNVEIFIINTSRYAGQERIPPIWKELTRCLKLMKKQRVSSSETPASKVEWRHKKVKLSQKESFIGHKKKSNFHRRSVVQKSQTLKEGKLHRSHTKSQSFTSIEKSEI